MHQIRIRPELRPGPRSEEIIQRSTDPLAGLRGDPSSKRKREKGEGGRGDGPLTTDFQKTAEHFCSTVLIISYVDSYRDIDSYVTILPSLPT